MRQGKLALLAALALLLPVVVCAQQDGAATAPGQAVDFSFVKSRIAHPAKPEVTLVDTRPPHGGYDAGHIPGAIHLPEEQFDRLAGSLPRDRRQLLIFYSEDAQRESSRQSAARAAGLGYDNTRVYAGGFADWLKNGGQAAVSAAFIDKLKTNRSLHVLIDARPARTAGRGMIPGAINIPDAEFDTQIAKLPADKSALLIYYCGGIDCPQSANSAEKARKLGYRNASTYPEGYPEWVKLHEAGQPAGK